MYFTICYEAKCLGDREGYEKHEKRETQKRVSVLLGERGKREKKQKADPSLKLVRMKTQPASQENKPCQASIPQKKIQPKQKAIVAVSLSVLVILYHVLRDKKPYHDLGADYFAKLDTTRLERHNIHQLEQLGYQVTLNPKEAA